ncbi:MAG: M1 family metallopeptidase, partial [Acidiferrobacterales bacterium]
IYHDLDLSLDPKNGRLIGRDTVILPDELITDRHDVSFSLHAGLHLTLEGEQSELIPLEASNIGVPVQRYRLRLAPGNKRFTVRYTGAIQHRLTGADESYGKAERATPGAISADGVYLTGRSYWYPHFADTLLTFAMEVALPVGWRAVSQGSNGQVAMSGDAASTRWRELKPQEEIYLVAGRYHEYRHEDTEPASVVFLRSPDAALATKYLDATQRYVELYGRLLGAYPYKKFALVENFWETGYGMPSFTLLGPRVIRLPFIIHSSYPHEILHNWWGNSVYVAKRGGNWSEGLTAYLADHLLAEQRGRGAEYRRGVLQKYADYAGKAREIALTDFWSRHDETSQAIGYGKALMLFHMLRLRLGDDVFVRALRHFYRTYQFRAASYSDIRRAFEAVSGADLNAEFVQWVERAGAPRLRVDELYARRDGDSHRLVGVLKQTQSGPSYKLSVPVAVYLEDEVQPFRRNFILDAHENRFEVSLRSRPWLVLIDPEFDVFRRLDHREIPPSLGQLFGAERVLIVVPSQAPTPVRERYRELAERWARGAGDIHWRWDNTLEKLPSDRSVWLLGWTNGFRSKLASAASKYRFSFAQDSVSIAGRTATRRTEAVVIAARHPRDGTYAIAWLACDNPAAFAGLARKLPHYGKYSYLVFEGDDPRNVLKGQWPVMDSPLRVQLGQRSGATGSNSRLRPHRPPLTAVLK